MRATAEIIPFPLERRRPARLVALPELIERFGYSERWWRYRLTEGLPARKWGAGLRFDPDEVKDWLEDRYGTA